MSRLAPFDKALVLILVPLWAVCFGLSLRSVLVHRAAPSIYVSAPEATDGYPTVRRLGTIFTTSASKSDLRLGDRLLRLEDSDLRGVGPYGFVVRLMEETGRARQIAVTVERDGRRIEAFLPFASYHTAWPMLPGSLAYALLAVFLMLRAPPSSLIRAAFLSSMCFAFFFACLTG